MFSILTTNYFTKAVLFHIPIMSLKKQKPKNSNKITLDYLILAHCNYGGYRFFFFFCLFKVLIYITAILLQQDLALAILHSKRLFLFIAIMNLSKTGDQKEN